MTRLSGLYIPLITPFGADGTIQAGVLESLAHAVLDDGASGLVALGTTGEPATLNAEEKRTVIAVCARVCRQRGVPLIVGAGTNDTCGSVRDLRVLAAWPEVTAALVPVPYYTRPSEAGVIEHYRFLAERGPLPLIVYHIPYRTGRSLRPDTLRALVALPGVTGVKHAGGEIDTGTVDFFAQVPPDFSVVAVADVFLAPLLALGAAGGILATAHLETRRFVELIDAWRAGDLDRARPLGHRLARLAAAVFAEPNPSVLKGVLHAQGRLPDPAVRLPLLPASTDMVDCALSLLAAMGEWQAGVQDPLIKRAAP